MESAKVVWMAEKWVELMVVSLAVSMVDQMDDQKVAERVQLKAVKTESWTVGLKVLLQVALKEIMWVAQKDAQMDSSWVDYLAA